jgi:hypothetical protein
MPKTGGMGDNLYVAQFNLSGDVGSIGKVSGGPAALDVTAIDKFGYEKIGGVRDGGIDFTSWFNPDALAEHAALKGLPTADVLVSYFRGTALGGEAASCLAKQLNYDGKRGSDGALSFDVSAEANAFGVEWGRMLTAGVRADTTATNGTGVDHVTVSTVFGLQAYLHVFSFTGTSVTIKIQDSADNAAFADVAGASFAVVAVPGAQRLAVAGTVRRYLRVATTGTFSQCSFAVQAIRNETAVSF